MGADEGMRSALAHSTAPAVRLLRSDGVDVVLLTPA